MADKIFAPMVVEGTSVTTQDLRKVHDKIANLPHKFIGMDLVSVLPERGHSIHFQQEISNRLLQRWRKMGLVVFKNKQWSLTKGAWDKIQEAWRDTRDA